MGAYTDSLLVDRTVLSFGAWLYEVRKEEVEELGHIIKVGDSLKERMKLYKIYLKFQTSDFAKRIRKSKFQGGITHDD